MKCALYAYVLRYSIPMVFCLAVPTAPTWVQLGCLSKVVHPQADLFRWSNGKICIPANDLLRCIFNCKIAMVPTNKGLWRNISHFSEPRTLLKSSPWLVKFWGRLLGGHLQRLSIHIFEYECILQEYIWWYPKNIYLWGLILDSAVQVIMQKNLNLKRSAIISNLLHCDFVLLVVRCHCPWKSSPSRFLFDPWKAPLLKKSRTCYRKLCTVKAKSCSR